MLQMKKQFADSFEELKSLKTIVVTAMFMAVGIVLGSFTIQLGNSLKLGFSFLANEMTALLFGPVVGGIMGGLTDIIKYIMKPTGPFFFGFTLNAILGAVIYGVMLYHKPISLKRILLAKAIVAVFVNMILGTYWLQVMYGKAFFALLPARAFKQVIFVPIESFLFYVVAKTFAETKVLQTLKS